MMTHHVHISLRRQQLQRTNGAASQGNVLRLANRGQHPLRPPVNPLVNGVHNSKKGALLLEERIRHHLGRLVAKSRIVGGGEGRIRREDGEGADGRRGPRAGEAGLGGGAVGEHGGNLFFAR